MSDADQRLREILAREAPPLESSPGVRAPERVFAIREMGGFITAWDGLIGASILAPPGDGRMVKRRCFPRATTPAARELQVLVIELGGVFTYCRTVDGRATVVVSRDGNLLL